MQENLEGYTILEFARYNVVDINNYTEEELLQEESFLSKALLIEKARYSNSLTANLEKIVQEINTKKQIYTNEQRELLITIINLALRTKLDEQEAEKLIKELKEGEKPMLAVLEMLEEENKKIFRDGRKEGEKRGRKQANLQNAKRMIEKGIDIKTIMEITELKEAEVKKLLK